MRRRRHGREAHGPAAHRGGVGAFGSLRPLRARSRLRAEARGAELCGAGFWVADGGDRRRVVPRLPPVVQLLPQRPRACSLSKKLPPPPRRLKRELQRLGKKLPRRKLLLKTTKRTRVVCMVVQLACLITLNKAQIILVFLLVQTYRPQLVL